MRASVLEVIVRRRPICRLWRGDCMDMMRAMRTESVHSIVTDPPFGIDFRRYSDKSCQLINDKQPFIWFLHDAYRVLRNGGGMLLFCRWDVQETFRWGIQLAGFQIRSEVIWDTRMHGMGDTKSAFAPAHGNIWFATKGHFSFPAGRPKSVFRERYVMGWDRIHPTEKPVKLLADLIKYITPAGGTVLDPCMGSASAGEACLQNGFGFVGMEIDGMYFRTAVARLRHVAQDRRRVVKGK